MSLLHRRRGGLIATSALILLTTASIALASPNPRPAPTTFRADFSCPLERIGSQLVKCDNLTGNGVPAPAVVPQQGSSARRSR
jgi:hypothetical protein